MFGMPSVRIKHSKNDKHFLKSISSVLILDKIFFKSLISLNTMPRPMSRQILDWFVTIPTILVTLSNVRVQIRDWLFEVGLTV
jgi:hypothetical protein